MLDLSCSPSPSLATLSPFSLSLIVSFFSVLSSCRYPPHFLLDVFAFCVLFPFPLDQQTGLSQCTDDSGSSFQLAAPYFPMPVKQTAWIGHSDNLSLGHTTSAAKQHPNKHSLSSHDSNQTAMSGHPLICCTPNTVMVSALFKTEVHKSSLAVDFFTLFRGSLNQIQGLKLHVGDESKKMEGAHLEQYHFPTTLRKKTNFKTL